MKHVDVITLTAGAMYRTYSVITYRLVCCSLTFSGKTLAAVDFRNVTLHTTFIVQISSSILKKIL